MITNLPQATDFENIAKQCLNQAFNIVYEIDNGLDYYDEPEREKVWVYHTGELSTSLILIYQAIESLMKSKICEVSSLLLLDLKRTDWPTMPSSADKDFNELFTIGGEALQKTYCAVLQSSKLDADLIKFVEEIRLARNKIVHGVSREHLGPEYLVETVLKTFTKFLGRDSWWISMRDQQIKSPVFGQFNTNYEEAFLIEKLEYTESILKPQNFRQHFSLDLKTRRYYCPWCADSLEGEDSELESKWAVLVPQKSKGATKIQCMNCQRVHTVLRGKCDDPACKGDVLYELETNGPRRCLTCNNTNEDNPTMTKYFA
jgi:hypothetical protein